MYPELFTIPGTSYTISTFGVMMALGFLVGFWITAWRMRELGMDAQAAPNILVWMMVGGVLGYFVLQVLEGWTPILLGIVAASMIYVAVADLIPGLHRRPELRAHAAR